MRGLTLSKSFMRYLLVGGSAYILEIIVIVIAQKLGASGVLAVAISFWVGLTYSFTLQKFFSFGDKRTQGKVLAPQIVAVIFLVIFNFGFTMAVTALLQHLVPTVISRTLAIGSTTLWNFYLYNKHIFRTTIID